MEQVESMNNKKVRGWGSDSDKLRRPYYPIHKNQDNTGAHWAVPERQKANVEILHSIERPDLTCVFGTSSPPKFLSGAIRRWAFKYSENSFAHWIPLMLADRIDFIEGMLEDIFKGKFPRILGDGYVTDYKYARKRFYFRVAKTIAITTSVIYLIDILFLKKKKANYRHIKNTF